ncbi:hypothetical protein GLU64_02905 [Nanohaloarchaea archaeon]|nr:hypothetical protein [Candidatus Nanohaloarchaea archaeon]
MRFDKALILVALLSLTGLAVSQPNLPHRIYGEISSFETGSPITGANITFRNSSGSILATQSTTDTGFYDLNVELKDSGQRFFLFVDGVNTSESLRFSRGSSEALNCRFDSSSSSCVENQNSDDTDQKEDDQNQDLNDEQNSDDQESGGGSTGGSGGGSGGGGSGGGGSPSGGFGGTGQDEQDKSPESENITVEIQLDNGSSATARIENLSEGQEVDINTEGSSLMRGLNFVSDRSFSDSEISFNSSLETVQYDQFRVLESFEIKSTNASASESFLAGFEVSDSVIQENDISPDELQLRTESGRRIDLSVVTGLGSYMYEADLGSLDVSYSLGFPALEEEKLDLSVRSISSNTSASEQNITVELANPESAPVEEAVNLSRDGVVVKTWDVALQPGEVEELRYSTSLDTGSYSFSVHDRFVEVQVQDKQDNEVPLLIIAAASIAVLMVLLALVLFLKGYRSASRLDQTIQEIERREQEVSEEVENVREDIERVREYVKGS